MAELDHLGINLWKPSSKATKFELIQEIAKVKKTKVLDIGALPLKDLKILLRRAKTGYVVRNTKNVTGRAKAPYIELINSELSANLSLEKLTVSELQTLLEVFKP